MASGCAASRAHFRLSLSQQQAPWKGFKIILLFTSTLKTNISIIYFMYVFFLSQSHMYDILAKCCHCRVVVSGCCNCVNLTLQTSATPQPGLRGVTRKPDSSELLYLCVPARFCGVVHTPVAGESWSYPRCKQLSGSSMWWVNNMTSEAVISKLKCHTRTCITASWGTILSWVSFLFVGACLIIFPYTSASAPY